MKDSINLGIWDELSRPIFMLAPMEDVTDTVFRQIVMECGRPDLMFTEFTSSEGICSPGRKHVVHRLEYEQEEKPLIAQIWGKSPEAYLEATKLVVKQGFDGVDINMGCPVAKIVKQGCCSALIDNPTLAIEIIEAVKEGAGDLPVSVKTRIGFKSKKTEVWAETLLKTGIAALTIHGRLAKDMSKLPADWDEIGKVVNIRNQMGLETLIIGNGDIKSLQQASDAVEKYGVDGVMIGRGIFENPWLFDESIDPTQVSKEEKLKLLLKHVESFNRKWGEKKNFAIMKKFLKVYVSGFSGAAELRAILYAADGYDDMRLKIDSAMRLV